MSAPNPGEAGVRLWGSPTETYFVRSEPSPHGEGLYCYVALPLAAHEALRSRVERLEGLLSLAKLWVEDGVAGRFVPRTNTVEALRRINEALAAGDAGDA